MKAVVSYNSSFKLNEARCLKPVSSKCKAAKPPSPTAVPIFLSFIRLLEFVSRLSDLCGWYTVVKWARSCRFVWLSVLHVLHGAFYRPVLSGEHRACRLGRSGLDLYCVLWNLMFFCCVAEESSFPVHDAVYCALWQDAASQKAWISLFYSLNMQKIEGRR